MQTLEEIIQIANERHKQLPGLTQRVLDAVHAGTVDVDDNGLYALAVLVSIAPSALLSAATASEPTLLTLLSTSVDANNGIRDILELRERQRLVAIASDDLADMSPEGVLSYANRVHTGATMD